MSSYFKVYLDLDNVKVPLRKLLLTLDYTSQSCMGHHMSLKWFILTQEKH